MLYLALLSAGAIALLSYRNIQAGEKLMSSIGSVNEYSISARKYFPRLRMLKLGSANLF